MPAPTPDTPGALIHEIIPVGMLQCNCSILGDSESGEAIVVDPGDDVARILEILRRRKLKVRAIVSTHTHIDHVGGLAELHGATSAPVLIHEADMPLYLSLETQAQWLGIPTPAMMQIRDFVKEGDALLWGNFAARVLHTPGHTLGSISLVVEPGGKPGAQAGSHARAANPASVLSAVQGSTTPPAAPSRLIAGDTLFEGSIGRTDLPGGSFPQIIRSIHDKLLSLPDDLVVYPGHGSTTTIGREREHNPFLR